MGTVDSTNPDEDPCPGRVTGDSSLRCCDDQPCDTHCTGLDVIVNGGLVEVFAAGPVVSGETIFFTFQVSNGVDLFTVGPQPGNSAVFSLAPGEWIIAVTVSDGSNCDPPADDATCTATVSISPTLRTPVGDGPSFIRGDANATGRVDIADGVAIILHLFAARQVDCLEAADTNGSGGVDLSDAVSVFSYLFQNGADPASPFPVCGTADSRPLTCEEFAGCASD